MLRILLCCGGGFSSSAIMVRMNNELKEKHLDDKYVIDYSPFTLALEKIDNYDIMICCPHLNVYVKQLLKQQELPLPVYILPPRIYGNMKSENIIMDCEDIMELYKQGHSNPVHFPGEENIMKVRRDQAYRKSRNS